MTTSISNASAETLQSDAATIATTTPRRNKASASSGVESKSEIGHTLASRFIVLVVCLAVVLSTLAYGTVHSWSLALFQVGAALIIVLWAADAWRTGVLRLSRNSLQWPLIGLCIIGFVQLLPLGGGRATDALANASRSLSLDPYSTRMALVQVLSLLIYFAATLAFTDSPRRLLLLVRTITIFGFLLAIFGLIQSFVSPTKIYGLRELSGVSTPFGPFINRHHFAGYMEMTLALPLGLLFSGATESDKRPLYIFAVVIMGIALILTNSRGGIISLFALICFLAGVAGIGARATRGEKDLNETEGRQRRVRAAMIRAAVGLALFIGLLGGVVLVGGESVLSRFVGTINANDPTNGRTHFWSVALEVIRHHPITGTGLGAFGMAYTQFDSSSGALLRLEQVHNDYLQVLADTGVIGAALGLFFIVTLFRMGFARRESEDVFRSGVATGALAGCFAVLVHSFFDFTLHTTSNALLFLVMAALATLNGRVEQQSRRTSRGGGQQRRRHRRSSTSNHSVHPPQSAAAATLPTAPEKLG